MNATSSTWHSLSLWNRCTNDSLTFSQSSMLTVDYAFLSWAHLHDQILHITSSLLFPIIILPFSVLHWHSCIPIICAICVFCFLSLSSSVQHISLLRIRHVAFVIYFFADIYFGIIMMDNKFININSNLYSAVEELNEIEKVFYLRFCGWLRLLLVMQPVDHSRVVWFYEKQLRVRLAWKKIWDSR